MSRYADLRAALIHLAAQMPSAHDRLQRLRQRGEEVKHLIPFATADDMIANTDIVQMHSGKKLMDDLMTVAEKAQITVQRAPKMKWRTALGYSEDGVITLREADHIETAHQAHVFAHELTHVLWHQDAPQKDPRLEECEAECVAHLLTGSYGFHVADSALYLATHGVTGPTIERMAHRIVADVAMLTMLAKENQRVGAA